MTTILDVPPKKLLSHFDSLLKQYGIAKPEAIIQEGLRTIKGLKASGAERDEIYGLRELHLRWYESLRQGTPDYSVYADNFYLAELWGCWIVYSRKYLRELRRPNILHTHDFFTEVGNMKRIMDLGCGFGYSTIALKELWPEAEVIGTNLQGTLQFEVASGLGQKHGFRMIDEQDTVSQPVDLIFASEYFEHIEKPVDHLTDLIHKVNPDRWLIANTFGPDAIGHFDEYEVNGATLSARETSQVFNQTLKDAGYEKVKTKFWNNRPAYFRKQTLND